MGSNTVYFYFLYYAPYLLECDIEIHGMAAVHLIEGLEIHAIGAKPQSVEIIGE